MGDTPELAVILEQHDAATPLTGRPPERHETPLLVVAVTSLLLPVLVTSDVQAQIQPPIAPIVTSDRCAAYELFAPSRRFHGACDAVVRRQVTDCLNELLAGLTAIPWPSNAAAVTTPARPPGGATVGSHSARPATRADKDNTGHAEQDLQDSEEKSRLNERLVHHQLLSVYLSYAKLKRWEQMLRSCDNWSRHVASSRERLGQARLVDAYNRLSEALHDELAEHGLLRAFSAQLISGFSFTSVGGQIATRASQADYSGVDSQATQPTGLVNWETLHFGSDAQGGLRPDVSIGGTVGFRPSLVLVTLPGKDANTTVGPLAAYEQSFVWDGALAVNFTLASLGELSPYWLAGQTILTSTDALLGDNGTSVIGTTIYNNTGRAEPFMEYGFRVNLFGESLSLLHVDKSVLAPMVGLKLGIRNDWRFKGEGALADYRNPQWRYVYSILIDTLQVVKRGASESPISLTIQVDSETSFHRPSAAFPLAVPSGTRVFIQGSTDIIKTFQGGGK